jgi:hypothetical protein
VSKLNKAVLSAPFKPLPKRRRIAALDPETHGMFQRNLATLMPAQVPPESFNTPHLLVHETGELLLRCRAPCGFRAYVCLTCHDLIFLQCFQKFCCD